MTTKVTGSVLANTAVTAGTYGSAGTAANHVVPVVTVDAQGRLTSAANVTITNTQVFANSGQLTANASTGVVAVGLATSGAIAGSYGSGTTTPVISVDAYGRITSVSATTITGGSAGVGATTFNRQSNTATSGQTVFTVTGGYTVGYLQVYLNGVLLNASDYTASNGTSFTLAVGATTGDIVESIAYTVSTVLNVGPSPSGGLAGQVLYQTAANTTGNTDVGTSSSILTSAGSGKPYWSAQSSLVIANTQITGVMTASQLAATAVTPATYGGASAIPVITVDQQGRLTSAANVAVTSGSSSNVQTFTSTGTWTKPSGVSMARIQLWGGGAGGSSGGNAGVAGGGGGAYNEITVPVSSLAATVTATVGAGGSGTTSGGAGGVGGTSSFALATPFNNISTLYAYGGGGGYSANANQGAGGGGGGSLGAGGSGASGNYSPGTPGAGAQAAGYFFSSTASTGPCSSVTVIYSVSGVDGGGYGYGQKLDSGGPFSPPILNSIFGGGGGASSTDIGVTGMALPTSGGRSLWGGGGGGAPANGVNLPAKPGGTSLYGGNGGNAGVAGTAPAGGGGSGAAGAAGKIIVTCW